jgi:microcystin-dependent protein
LFAVIGTTYGAGDGSTTFQLPDLRGQFIRGWNSTGAGCDASRVFGSTQAGMVGPHVHDLLANTFDYAASYSASTQRGALGLASCQITTSVKPNFTPYCFVCDPATPTQSAIQANTGTETRPTNVAMLPCIKWQVTTAPANPASSGIPCSTLVSKGALVTASTANTPTALPSGTDGQVLTACAAATTGLSSAGTALAFAFAFALLVALGFGSDGGTESSTTGSAFAFALDLAVGFGCSISAVKSIVSIYIYFYYIFVLRKSLAYVSCCLYTNPQSKRVYEYLIHDTYIYEET